MNDDDFDQLVDDATHAVINLIPAEYFYDLSPHQREGLTVQINDALTQVLRDVGDDGGEF